MAAVEGDVPLEFFETIKARRSVRHYTDEPVPKEVIERSLDAALIAPNSSNLQTWQFYWVQSPDKKKELVNICLNQSAAKTAQEIIVVVANPKIWKKINPELLRAVKDLNAPKPVQHYYQNIIPFIYGFQWLNPIKWVLKNVLGLFKPMYRFPSSYNQLLNISVKSAALACENFMLSVVDQGYACCPMEGLDEVRMKKMLGLDGDSKIVMAISVGRADPKRGTWGPQIRFNRNWFVHYI